MIYREFKALGTEIIIGASLSESQEYILAEMEAMIFDFEKKFSRFIIGNELSRFNNLKETDFQVSETMADLLKISKEYYLKTSGIFDPTIIGSLEVLGYDKSFSELSLEISNKPALNDGVKLVAEKSKEEKIINLKKAFVLRPRLSELEISDRLIKQPLGLRLDFGGIGKGYLVDLLVKKYFSGIKDFWISAGGDIIISGSDTGQIGWKLGVQNPHLPDEDIFSIYSQGKKIGVATSGIIKRAGGEGEYKWHHIIDPRTGLSVLNDILSVTLISSSALKADIFAKTVLILGEQAGLKFLESELDSVAIIFTKDKRVVYSSRAKQYLNNL